MRFFIILCFPDWGTFSSLTWLEWHPFEDLGRKHSFLFNKCIYHGEEGNMDKFQRISKWGLWQWLQARLSHPVHHFPFFCQKEGRWVGQGEEPMPEIIPVKHRNRCSSLSVVDFLISVSSFLSSLPGVVVSGFISVSLLLTALPSVQMIMCSSVFLSSLLLDNDPGVWPLMSPS